MVGIKFFYAIFAWWCKDLDPYLLTNGSRSERLKNMWIRWIQIQIRISNTAFYVWRWGWVKLLVQKKRENLANFWVGSESRIQIRFNFGIQIRIWIWSWIRIQIQIESKTNFRPDPNLKPDPRLLFRICNTGIHPLLHWLIGIRY